MGFILSFLGTLFGIIAAVAIIVMVVMRKLNKVVGKNNMRQIMRAAKNVKSLEAEEYTRKKDVSGMTKLLEPQIIEDFPDFNKNLLFSKIESNLTKIFDAIERKAMDTISNDQDLELMKNTIEDYIEDLKNHGIDLEYSSVRYHNHAIKGYEKRDGMATITTSTSLEYYYRNSEIENRHSNLKKQTRYTCKFVYIYDEAKLKTRGEVFSINCPNCGAPLKGLNASSCEYCSSSITPVNLKIWKMSSYKEDYE